MRLKPLPRTKEVREVQGNPNDELAERCPDRRTMLPEETCTNQSCPWSVNALPYKNCSFVVFQAVDVTGNKLSLEEIGEMEGLTREGVRQIEKRALRKLRVYLSQNSDSEPAIESLSTFVDVVLQTDLHTTGP